jgi:putative DNA methylase
MVFAVDPHASATLATMLEVAFPFRELSCVISSDRRARDPLYAVHRWWARRPPALLRAVLIAASLPAETSPEQFWEAYGSPDQLLKGLHVHDPFMGGGSTLVEAARLGATVSGSDVDPLAAEIVRYELDPAPADEVREVGEGLLEHVRAQCGHLFPAHHGVQPLHYFWLHVVTCPHCGLAGLLYRNLVLARDRNKPGAVVREKSLTVFCPEDLSIHNLGNPDQRRLHHAGRYWPINEGSFSAQRYVCQGCGEKSTHKELRTGVAPRQLVAVEETPTGERRRIRPGVEDDDRSTQQAREWLVDHAADLSLPDIPFAVVRHDARPVSFGMHMIRDLFSDRQLAVLGTAMAWVETTDLVPQVRAALRLSVSNALATNNRLCSYAQDYGRLSALFSVRGYSLPALPVELNPLHPDAGRGTLAHCIERVARAGDSAVRRHGWSPSAARVEAMELELGTHADTAQVVCSSATTSPRRGAPTAQLGIFDPPYFDYIAYTELSELYRAWLPIPTPLAAPLMPVGDGGGEAFGLELGAALRSLLARLELGRPLAFTYHSTNPEAWQAVAIALDEAKLAVTALWPIRSDGHMGHHSHPGNCEWDIVLVCRRISESQPAPARFTVEGWAEAAGAFEIGAADRVSMELAIAIVTPRFATVPEETP